MRREEKVSLLPDYGAEARVQLHYNSWRVDFSGANDILSETSVPSCGARYKESTAANVIKFYINIQLFKFFTFFLEKMKL